LVGDLFSVSALRKKAIMKKTHIWTLTGVLGIALILACTKESGEQATSESYTVEKPLKQIEIPENLQAFDSNEPYEFKSEKGSKVRIEAGTLVDRDGNDYQGEAQLAFTEYHTNAEVLACGLPMRYDSAGKIGHFTTAGMFNIQCFDKENNPLFIKEGKEIMIDMASHQEMDDYNLYFFEEDEAVELAALNLRRKKEKKGKWKFLQRTKAQINPDVAEVESEMVDLGEAPTLPPAFDENKFTFDISADYEKHPELKPFQGTLWQYAGTAAASDPENNQWIFDTPNWDKISLNETSRGTYNLVFQAGKKSFETEVIPLLPEEEMAEKTASFEKKLAEFQQIKKEQRAAKSRLQRIGKMVRTFPITTFGNYNCDAILYVINQAKTKKARLTFKRDGQEVDVFYHIASKDGRSTVVRYDKTNRDEFFFYPNLNNKIVAPYQGQEVAVLGQKSFRTMARKIGDDTEFFGDLTSSPQEINTLEDLENAIQKAQ
jgi:hypothetical protein